MSGPVPARVIFTFLAACNMKCRFCYLNFGEPKSDLREWKRIVERIAEFGTESITFGGGDPFMYREFPRLLIEAKNLGFSFIQVDSNGLALRPEHSEILRENCHLMGLPLDGSTSSLNDAIRGQKGHYEKVLSSLKELAEEKIPLKLNTVVCRQNVKDLANMAGLLGPFPLSVWSLYEFWSIGPSTEVANDFGVTNEEFQEATRSLQRFVPHIPLETGAVETRRRCYFFVTHTGRAYTIDPADSSKYLTFGSIFDDAITEKWQSLAEPGLTANRIAARMNVVDSWLQTSTSRR
jgi:MoaA/NifB/PqqE/SkfB family radical SAM enzyme